MDENEEFEFRLRAEQEAQGAGAPAEVEEPPERSFGDSLVRQLGLTARAGLEGIAAPGAMVGDVLGMRSSEAMRNLLTRAGLPLPEGSTEEIANVAAGAMAGAGGLSRVAKAIPAARALAESPGLNVASAGAAGAAGETVQEAGGSPLEQAAAGFGASLVAPSAVAAGKQVGNVVGDVAATLRAAFGHQPSIERIATDAVKELTRSNPAAIAGALERAKPEMGGVQPDVAQAVARRNLEQPGEQVGGALVKMQESLSGAKGIEDILPTAMAKQEQAVGEYVKNLGRLTDPMRETALAKARAGGTQTLSILGDVAKLLGKPEYQGSKVAMLAIRGVGRNIMRVTDEKTGFADPAALYSIRKEIGTEIRKAVQQAGGANARWDKTMSIGIDRALQNSIDDAIEAAGGTGWKTYLRTYAEGMEPLNRRAKVLEKAVEMAGETEKRATSELAKAEIPPIPTLLHRPTMMVNFALKLIAKDATEPVTRELAKRMADPAKFRELMLRPERSPARQKATEILSRAAILANLIQQHQADQPAQEE